MYYHLELQCTLSYYESTIYKPSVDNVAFATLASLSLLLVALGLKSQYFVVTSRLCFFCVFRSSFVCICECVLKIVVSSDPIFITHWFKEGGEALASCSDKCITPINPVSTEVLNADTHIDRHKHIHRGKVGMGRWRR